MPQNTTQQRILALLHSTEQRTVAEVAEATGLARSTVSAVLGALLAEGSVVKVAAGQPGKPSLWRAKNFDARHADGDLIGAATKKVQKAAAVPDGWLRLATIREEVLLILAEATGTPMTPHAISRRTGRSAGAIANSAERLRAEGVIELASKKPQSYLRKR